MPPEMASRQLLIKQLELRALTLRRMLLCKAAAYEAGTSSSSTQSLARPIEGIPPGLWPQPRHDFPPLAPQFAAGHADSDPPRLPSARLDVVETLPANQGPLLFAELELLSQVEGLAGMVATAKMQELRQSALQHQGQWTVDLTRADWPWRRVLRAACKVNRAFIVGPGITSFAFRFIPGTLDPTTRALTVASDTYLKFIARTAQCATSTITRGATWTGRTFCPWATVCLSLRLTFCRDFLAGSTGLLRWNCPVSVRRDNFAPRTTAAELDRRCLSALRCNVELPLATEGGRGHVAMCCKPVIVPAS
jgi:hypothetical protein